MAGKAQRRRESSARAPAAPAPAPRVPPTAGDPAWAVPAARVVVALGTLALLIVAFAAHPLGDHFTESDFYEYAAGGRAIARGSVDFARYGVIGPVYEFLLAIPALLGIPAFTFARLLSVAAVTIFALAWLEIVRRRLGGLAALVMVTLLFANAVLFRYGYSSTTDVTALAFQAVSLWALLAGRGRAAPWVAGAAAALATLTRYNSAFLLPGAIAFLLVLANAPPAARRAALVRWLAAFAIVVTPWTLVSAAHGHWPGEDLFSNATFYANPSARERNVQDRPEGRPAAETDRRGFAVRVITNAPAHLVEDARGVLGWPTAGLCALGLVILLAERRARAWLPLGLNGAFAFLALAPVFYSDRYSLAVLPFYLSLAGAAAASSRLAALAGRARPLVPALLVAWPLVASLDANVKLQRYVRGQLPRDVLAAAPALRRELHPDDGVIARKGALAFWGGGRPVAFPRLASLAEMAAHADANRARFIYYSWYEGMLRPEFLYLLDTTAVIPGLARIASVTEPAALLYRIEPGFGRDPAWMTDSTERSVHLARGEIRALDDRDPWTAWDAHSFLGREAGLAGRWEEALVQFEMMTRSRPEDTRGWVYAGDARAALGNLAAARTAYERALAINPRSLGAGLGIGWTFCAEERWEQAAAAWRPLVGATRDPRTLDAMIDVFTRVGDAAAAEQARQARAAVAAP
jgi:tetratricopeptide (TPR) repeat protein